MGSLSLLGKFNARINCGAGWTLFCAVCFAKNRHAYGVRFNAFVWLLNVFEVLTKHSMFLYVNHLGKIILVLSRYSN